jgi:hypothetical protein
MLNVEIRRFAHRCISRRTQRVSDGGTTWQVR